MGSSLMLSEGPGTANQYFNTHTHLCFFTAVQTWVKLRTVTPTDSRPLWPRVLCQQCEVKSGEPEPERDTGTVCLLFNQSLHVFSGFADGCKNTSGTDGNMVEWVGLCIPRDVGWDKEGGWGMWEKGKTAQVDITEKRRRLRARVDECVCGGMKLMEKAAKDSRQGRGCLFLRSRTPTNINVGTSRNSSTHLVVFSSSHKPQAGWFRVRHKGWRTPGSRQTF